LDEQKYEGWVSEVEDVKPNWEENMFPKQNKILWNNADLQQRRLNLYKVFNMNTSNMVKKEQDKAVEFNKKVVNFLYYLTNKDSLRMERHI
jgi:hypothetical protein